MSPFTRSITLHGMGTQSWTSSSSQREQSAHTSVCRQQLANNFTPDTHHLLVPELEWGKIFLFAWCISWGEGRGISETLYVKHQLMQLQVKFTESKCTGKNPDRCQQWQSRRILKTWLLLSNKLIKNHVQELPQSHYGDNWEGRLL